MLVRRLRHEKVAPAQDAINGLQNRDVEKAIGLLERTRKDHRQPGRHWNSLKGNTRKTSERRDTATLGKLPKGGILRIKGFLERADTSLE